MDELITLAYGSGGRQAHELVRKIFAETFGMPKLLTDSAILEESGFTLAFTTDSYVIDPVFFPGGDIGKLAVCGTVNDLAVSGADPEYISASFIIEEGLSLADLRVIVKSMSTEAKKAGVKIVTGDTKVVEKGKCDKLFITTSGIGIIDQGREMISTGKGVKPGDRLIVTGSMGNHAVAVLGARKMLNFSTPVTSDCASLNHMIKSVLENCGKVKFMRDVTRGGLATVLNELSEMTGYSVSINEETVPVDEPVKGVCEILGFDPLYLANEGKIVMVVGKGEEAKALDILRADPLGKKSAIIGEIMSDKKGMVVLNTSSGGTRILDMPSGMLLPRIC